MPPGIKVIPGITPSHGGASDPNKVLTSWEDLAGAGISQDYVKKMFESNFHGETPKSLHLNEGICVTFGHYCYNTPGTATYSNTKMVVRDKVADTKNISNHSNFPIKSTVKLTTEESRSATLTVTKESSFTFGNSISVSAAELGISDTFSESFTIKNTVGSTDTSSTKVTVEDSIMISLPPNSSVVAELEVTWTQLTEDFEIPIAINGMVGADFGKRVNGHYYWFLELPARNSTMKGKVLCAYDIKGDIIVTGA